MSYTLTFSKEAAKALRKMPRNLAQRIRRKLEILAQDPLIENANVKALQGRDAYRLRVGDWRVIYELDHGRLVILVVTIAPRGSAYKQ